MGIRCIYCGSRNIIKKGLRKNKFVVKQIYKCKSCRKRFVLDDLENKTYPAKVVMRAISNYNLGYNLEKSAKLINQRYKIKVPVKTIYSWIREFEKICSFSRIRKKVIKMFSPDKIILKKLFEHQQPYKFLYHKAKAELFINKYFSGLKDYLLNIGKNCPDELFKNNKRGSSVKLDINLNKIKIAKKKNYACKLAKLALKAVSDNRKRHDLLEEFMLINDTCTIAVEVPVYLLHDEIKYYKFVGDISDAVSGHIDFVQMKFGLIYVLDYKPEASKTEAISQLFVYALALSSRTGIWLRNFRCAWFDADEYYEFNPSEIILNFDKKMPKWKLKEFLSDDKARSFFTSKRFHEKYGERK